MLSLEINSSKHKQLSSSPGIGNSNLSFGSNQSSSPLLSDKLPSNHQLNSSSSSSSVSGAPQTTTNSTTAGATTAATTTTKRRSSWRNLLTPSYKFRSDEFHKLFQDKIPTSERLIADYACALHREILIQGRIYISINYIAFYSNLFSWITKLVIRLRDISEIYKANTARIIPNAIQLILANKEKHVFASFVARDKSYVMLLRIWQNNLMQERMTDQELRNLVHFSYGKDLGMNDNEELKINSPDPVTPATIPIEQQQVIADSDQEKREEALAEELPPPPSPAPSPPSPDPSEEEDNKPRTISEPTTSELVETRPERSLIIPEEEEEEEDDDDLNEATRRVDGEELLELTTNCDCQEHLGQLIADQEFEINVDTLFTLIFTNSKFMRSYMVRRGMTDAIVSSWKRSKTSMADGAESKSSTLSSSSKRIPNELGDFGEKPVNEAEQVRQLNYSMNLNHLWAKQVQIEEQQNICQVKPGVYVLKSTTINSGIPYGESFTVDICYCLTRNCDLNKSRMLVHSYVNFNKEKQNWKLAMVKSMIEKQSLNGVSDFINDLTNCIREYISEAFVKKSAIPIELADERASNGSPANGAGERLDSSTPSLRSHHRQRRQPASSSRQQLAARAKSKLKERKLKSMYKYYIRGGREADVENGDSLVQPNSPSLADSDTDSELFCSSPAASETDNDSMLMIINQATDDQLSSAAAAEQRLEPDWSLSEADAERQQRAPRRLSRKSRPSTGHSQPQQQQQQQSRHRRSASLQVAGELSGRPPQRADKSGPMLPLFASCLGGSKPSASSRRGPAWSPIWRNLLSIALALFVFFLVVSHSIILRQLDSLELRLANLQRAANCNAANGLSAGPSPKLAADELR